MRNYPMTGSNLLAEIIRDKYRKEYDRVLDVDTITRILSIRDEILRSDESSGFTGLNRPKVKYRKEGNKTVRFTEPDF